MMFVRGGNGGSTNCITSGIFIYLKKIAGVVPGPQAIPPISTTPYDTQLRISIMPGVAWLFRVRSVLLLNPECKRTRVQGY